MRLNGWSFTIKLTCVTTLCLVATSLAQSMQATQDDGSYPPASSATDTASGALAEPQRTLSRPDTTKAVHGESEQADVRTSDKVAHLRRAVQHLTAAERPALARRVAREAEFEEKLEQIRRLQAEVQKLRVTSTTEQAVILQLKIMELQVTKMRKLGLDFQFASGSGFEQITGEVTDKLGAFNGLIDALRQHELVRVLAEPTMVTVSGRPATFQSKGEFPIVVPRNRGKQAVEYRQFGTRVDCMAEVMDSGRIRLQLCPTISEIDTSRSVTIQGSPVPALRTRSVDTAVEMEAGQTLILSGMTQSGPKHAGNSDEVEETMLLLMVTASLGGPATQSKNQELERSLSR